MFVPTNCSQSHHSNAENVETLLSFISALQMPEKTLRVQFPDFPENVMSLRLNNQHELEVYFSTPKGHFKSLRDIELEQPSFASKLKPLQDYIATCIDYNRLGKMG